MFYLWLKALHIFFVIAWFAGVFYLPRLFVHHAMSDDQATRDRLKIMERKLYRFITPIMVLALAFGIAMLFTAMGRAWLSMGWLHLKLVLVVALVVYHLWCGRLLKGFANDENPHSHKWYRWFNEMPVLVLLSIVFLVVLKPF